MDCIQESVECSKRGNGEGAMESVPELEVSGLMACLKAESIPFRMDNASH